MPSPNSLTPQALTYNQQNSNHLHQHSFSRGCQNLCSGCKKQVRQLEGFRAWHRKYTGTTPWGFLCFTTEVYRCDTFRVSVLHTGSIQLQHLQGFFASHKIYTGTTPLGFLRVTQESQVRHLEGFCASQKKYTGTTPLGFLRLTQDRHRHHTFRVSLLLTTPLGFLFFTQEGRRYDTLRVSSLLRTGSTQVRRV